MNDWSWMTPEDKAMYAKMSPEERASWRQRYDQVSKVMGHDAARKTARGFLRDPRTQSRVEADSRLRNTQSEIERLARERGGSEFRAQQQQVADLLMKRARGEDSMAAEQLRQDAQRNIGQMAGLASSVAPQDRGLAARAAIQQAGEVNQALAGQQRMAGIQERQSATESLGGIVGQARGQDDAAVFGGLGSVAGISENMLERARLEREAQRRANSGTGFGAFGNLLMQGAKLAADAKTGGAVSAATKKKEE